MPFFVTKSYYTFNNILYLYIIYIIVVCISYSVFLSYSRLRGARRYNTAIIIYIYIYILTICEINSRRIQTIKKVWSGSNNVLYCMLYISLQGASHRVSLTKFRCVYILSIEIVCSEKFPSIKYNIYVPMYITISSVSLASR